MTVEKIQCDSGCGTEIEMTDDHQCICGLYLCGKEKCWKQHDGQVWIEKVDN